MKREFLQNFKVGEQALPKEIIDAIMNENGNDIEATKKPFSDYEGIKSQLAAANRAIEDFKGMDIDSIKLAADDWKEKAEKAERDAAAKIADMEFSYALDGALKVAKARDPLGLKAHLDMDGLKLNNGKLVGLDEQLAKAREQYGFLFEENEAQPSFAAATPGATDKPLDKMTYTEMTAYLQAHPGAEI